MDTHAPAARAVDTSRALAAAIARFDGGTPPPAVYATARRFLLDTLGVIAAARSAPGLAELARRLARWEPHGSATALIGRARHSPPTAALANGSAAHALDFDDQHDPARVHTNCVVVPTLLALAEDAGPIDGRRFLLGWVIGAEIHARLGLACYNSLGKGWHPTMVHGTLAAALAGAHMLGLAEPQLAHALGIAFHQAAGSHQSARDGALTKRIGAGFAARNAVTSACLAQDGITGTHATFDGNAGFFALYERGEVDVSILLDDLGTRWRVLEYSVKPYPCCRCNHTLIGLGIDAWRQGVRGEDVASVTGGLGKVNWLTVGAPYDGARDQVAHAQFNGAFSLACALTDGTVGLAHYRRPTITRPDIVALASRIRIEEDPGVEPTAIEPAWIEITLRDGRRLRLARDTIKGSPAEPFTDAELAAKYLDCMLNGAGVTRDEADRLAEAIAGIESSRDVARDLLAAFPVLAMG